MKRIGLAAIWQESNSFSPILTRKEDYECYGVARGRVVLDQFGRTNEPGGFLEGIRGWSMDAEPIGLLRAEAWPSGPLSADTLTWLTESLLEELEKAPPLDGLLLGLHGSLVAESTPDADGAILAAVREQVGDDLPIVVAIDLHAHITGAMLAHADCIVAFHTQPHLDRKETGMRAAAVLERLLAGATPQMGFVRLPMVTPAEPQQTSGAVLSPLFRKLGELEGEDEILSASILMTQPWLDVPDLGWSCLVYTDGNRARAEREAEDLAEACWGIREQMDVERFTAGECVERALAIEGRPVVIADGSDSTNSGACGDSTHLLRAFAAQPIPGGALLFLVDPEAVQTARGAGVGGAFRAAVGGKRDAVFSTPVDIEGTVERVGTVRYVLDGHGGTQLPIDMGMSAVVRTGDRTILLVEKTGPGSTPLLYRSAGLEPKEFKIVVAKSPTGFRAEYEPFAAGILLSDCPGCATPRFEDLPYTRINRPLWPMDDIRSRRHGGEVH